MVSYITGEDVEINIKEFKKMQDFFKEINAMTIEDIEIEGIEILPKVREEFAMIGRNNKDLVEILIDANDNGINPMVDFWEDGK